MTAQLLERGRELLDTAPEPSSDPSPIVPPHPAPRRPLSSTVLPVMGVCAMALACWIVGSIGHTGGPAPSPPAQAPLLRPMAFAALGLYLYASRGPSAAVRTTSKRALDVVGASVALIVSLPLVAVAAVLVKVGDGGPVLFRQRRVGLGGTEFVLFKLRTMAPDAERRRSEVLDQNIRTGPLFKAAVDPRVTRVGCWLRALSIDELPQLVNVIRGEMSLVGPRPALPSETVQFDDELRERRHSVRPGITGLWQVEARDDPCMEVYRRLDLLYVDSWTLWSDLRILARTLGVVIVGGGQRLLRGERR